MDAKFDQFKNHEWGPFVGSNVRPIAHNTLLVRLTKDNLNGTT